MTPKEQYQVYRKEVGKDAMHTLLFFFFWLPLAGFVIVYGAMLLFS